MKASDRYIIAKMFLLIIQGFGVLVNVLHNPSTTTVDSWMDKTESFAHEVDKWIKGDK